MDEAGNDAEDLAAALDHEAGNLTWPSINMVQWLIKFDEHGVLPPASDRWAKSDRGFALATAMAALRRGWVVENTVIGHTRIFSITPDGRSALRRWQRKVRPLVEART